MKSVYASTCALIFFFLPLAAGGERAFPELDSEEAVELPTFIVYGDSIEDAGFAVSAKFRHHFKPEEEAGRIRLTVESKESGKSRVVVLKFDSAPEKVPSQEG